MAKMIPNVDSTCIRYDGERRVYRCLRDGLDDSYTVFYSVKLNQPVGRGAGFCREREGDFVVLHPRRGLLVIEVKGGRGVSFENRRWMRDGVPLDPQPDDQAQGFMHALVDQLRARGVTAPLSYSFAIALPHVAWKGAPPLGLDARQLLDRTMASDVEAFVKSAFAVLAQPKDLMPPQDLDLIVDALRGTISVFVPVGEVVDETMAKLWTLDAMQLAVHQQLLFGRQRLLCKGGGKNGKMSPFPAPGMGPGKAFGKRPTGPDENTGLTKTGVKNTAKASEPIARWFVKGTQVKGESKQEYKDVARVAGDQASEAISENRIPPEFHDAVKKYFGEMEKAGQ